jgi:hypothetical protein
MLQSDLNLLKNGMAYLPTVWEGKQCILEMKEIDFQWRQMEWWAFYFEMIVKRNLHNQFRFPGDKIGNVSFDLKGQRNWDLKAKAIKSDTFQAILNDKNAMESIVQSDGEMGIVIGLCDVEYNDVNRSFQKWHSELKGGKSVYELAREERTATSRYRKTRVELVEIVYLRITQDNIGYLDIHRQGRNSNGKPRQEKYMLDFEKIDYFLVDKMVMTR